MAADSPDPVPAPADLVGVVLAAGAGTRLRPLTLERPKALCPVAGVALVDHAIGRVGAVVDDIAVNLHHGGAALEAHLPPAIHRSWERAEALGTAGALGAMAAWLHGCDVLLANADAWLDGCDVDGFVAGWDRTRVRLLCVDDAQRGDFGVLRYCGLALLPGAGVERLEARPSGLYEVWWRAEAEAGRLDLVVHDGAFVDCGTPADYLEANLRATGGRGWIDPDASVGKGAEVRSSVVWPGASVAAGERLERAIRTPRATVLVR